jgi:hypothetical protein
MKLLIKLVVVLVVLVVLGVGVVVYAIDAIARAGIERGATYALGVETKLASADVSIRSGRFEMGGLRVANPEGFTDPQFMHLDTGGVEVALGSLRQETVELPVLHLGGIGVNVERSGGKANYDVIIANLKRFETGGGAPETGGGTADPDAGGGKKFIIREIVISDVGVNARLAPVGGELTKVSATIDEIRLKDVGSETGGAAMAEITSIIVKAIFAAMIHADILPADMLKDLDGALDQLEDLKSLGVDVLTETSGQLKSVGDDGGKVLEDVGKEIGEAVEGLGEGLGELLGGKKEK